MTRNQLCTCGSGKRFKHCHGRMPAEPSSFGQAGALQEINRLRALEFQRVRQQGRGKPIISAEVNGTRFVAIGSQIAYGNWETFQDFLLHYAKSTLGLSWGQLEMSKPTGEQHPFVRALEVLANLRDMHVTNPDGINSMPEYGAARAVFGLAYDLYLIQHHTRSDGDELAFERLLARIRRRDQFFGARHEARAAGILLRAGFDLVWEDEKDRSAGGHAEFLATYPKTGRSFWVECKMRQSEDDSGPAKFTHLVSAALQKRTTLERIVFVELNLPNGRVEDGAGWPGWAVNQLRTLESQPRAADLPSALMLISNFSEYRYLDRLCEGAGFLLEGFKIDGYRLGEIIDLRDAIDARAKYPEIESLWQSMQEHLSVPATFDGSIPGLNESERLLVGHTYEFSSGEFGVLEDATVVEEWRRAAGIFRLPTGERCIVQFDLSEDELEAWRRHPETFFGDLRPSSRPAENPLDLFYFFMDAYAGTPKERLIQIMGERGDSEGLEELSQQDLLKRYAYLLTADAHQDREIEVPAWHRRLKRRPHAEKGK